MVQKEIEMEKQINSKLDEILSRIAKLENQITKISSKFNDFENLFRNENSKNLTPDRRKKKLSPTNPYRSQAPSTNSKTKNEEEPIQNTSLHSFFDNAESRKSSDDNRKQKEKSKKQIIEDEDSESLSFDDEEIQVHPAPPKEKKLNQVKSNTNDDKSKLKNIPKYNEKSNSSSQQTTQKSDSQPQVKKVISQPFIRKIIAPPNPKRNNDESNK